MSRVQRIAIPIKELQNKWSSYQHYGHYRADKPPYPALWLWRNGVVEVKEVHGEEYGDASSQIAHDDLFPGFSASLSTSPYYWGRYAPNKKTITVIVPQRFWHRDVPSILVRDLERKFPEAEQILIFNSGL